MGKPGAHHNYRIPKPEKRKTNVGLSEEAHRAAEELSILMGGAKKPEIFERALLRLRDELRRDAEIPAEHTIKCIRCGWVGDEREASCNGGDYTCGVCLDFHAVPIAEFESRRAAPSSPAVE